MSAPASACAKRIVFTENLRTTLWLGGRIGGSGGCNYGRGCGLRYGGGTMRRFALSLAVVSGLIGLPVSIHAQNTNSAVVSVPGEGRVTEWVYGLRIPAVRGLPFSAKVELETVSQLQDGTQIARKRTIWTRGIRWDERTTRCEIGLRRTARSRS